MKRRTFLKTASFAGVAASAGFVAGGEALAAKSGQSSIPQLPADIAGDLSFARPNMSAAIRA